MSYLHDFVSAHIAGLRFAPADSGSFDYRLTTRRLSHGVLLGETRYSAVTGTRADLAADSRENYVLSIHDTDYELSIGGREWTVKAGDVVIVDEGSPYRFRLPGTGATIVSLDRHRAIRLAPAIASRPAHHVGAASPSAALLAGYVDLLRRSPLDGDTNAIAQHIYDLVALMLGTGESASDRPRAGIAEARLALIESDIEAHLADPSLSVRCVARRQRMTPRYVQQLLARRGTSFSDFVRERRLERALDMLRRPSELHRTISDVAFDAGFGDLSSFNRAFRKRFDTTPSDIRARTIAETGRGRA